MCSVCYMKYRILTCKNRFQDISSIFEWHHKHLNCTLVIVSIVIHPNFLSQNGIFQWNKIYQRQNYLTKTKNYTQITKSLPKLVAFKISGASLVKKSSMVFAKYLNLNTNYTSVTRKKKQKKNILLSTINCKY